MFENIFERFNAHFKMLYSISSSILSPRHLTKPSLPTESNLTPLFPAIAVPALTYDFLKEFYPKDYPTRRVKGSLFLIIILTSPSVTI